MSRPRKTIEQYEAEAKREGGCLISPKGRGVARRVYILRHGPLPSTVAVCHTCDNPRCIEDAHHFAGTWRDNVRDAVRKGRHSCFQNAVKKGERRKGFGALRNTTPAVRKKISDGLKRAYMEGRKSRVRTDETRRKISETKKGVSLSPQHRARIAEGLRRAYAEGRR